MDDRRRLTLVVLYGTALILALAVISLAWIWTQAGGPATPTPWAPALPATATPHATATPGWWENLPTPPAWPTTPEGGRP